MELLSADKLPEEEEVVPEGWDGACGCAGLPQAVRPSRSVKLTKIAKSRFMCKYLLLLLGLQRHIKIGSGSTAVDEEGGAGDKRALAAQQSSATSATSSAVPGRPAGQLANIFLVNLS